MAKSFWPFDHQQQKQQQQQPWQLTAPMMHSQSHSLSHSFIGIRLVFARNFKYFLKLLLSLAANIAWDKAARPGQARQTEMLIGNGIEVGPSLK